MIFLVWIKNQFCSFEAGLIAKLLKNHFSSGASKITKKSGMNRRKRKLERKTESILLSYQDIREDFMKATLINDLHALT